jgi:adenosylcobinamide-GDP ribazoletransferase
MKNLLLALQFLTVIPVKIKNIDESKIPEALIYFPFVGLFLGLILLGINNLLSILSFEPFLINIILVILLISLTGGIHLDGLADTADAFLSRKHKEEMLKIMQDSHIGVMGVLSLISVLLLKIAFLSSVSISLKTISLLLMCILSRWALVFAMYLFPYARQQGKAKIFIQGMNLKIFFLATVITLVCTLLIWQLKGLLVIVIITMSTYIIGKFITHRIGGITGDTLGAINELTEVIILFSVCILEKSNLWII